MVACKQAYIVSLQQACEEAVLEAQREGKHRLGVKTQQDTYDFVSLMQGPICWDISTLC